MKKWIYVIVALLIGCGGYLFSQNSEPLSKALPPSTFVKSAQDTPPNAERVTIKNSDLEKSKQPIIKSNSMDNTNQLLSLKGKDLDNEVLSFLNNKQIPRSEKLATLLAILEKVGFNSEKGNYFLDVLNSLKPIEISEQLINQFQSGNLSDNTKNSLLRILANSYGLDTSKSTPEMAQFIAKKSIAIHDFFTQQIQNPASKETFKQAITLYPSVSSAYEIPLLNDALTKHQNLISIQEGLAIRLDSAIATQNAQENNLPELLKSVQQSSFKPEIKKEFNNRLFSLLQQPVSDKMVSEIAKPDVINYLKSQEPALNNANAEFNALSDYYSWLNAYAAMSSEQNNRAAFMANFMNQSATAIQQAAVISFSDNNLVSELQQNPMLQANLQKELTNPQLTAAAKQVIQEAITKLQK